MKKRELERRLVALGWWLKRHGGRHDYWTDGSSDQAVPRHAEIDESLARKILRSASTRRR
jgi:mRNA interferase HicA